MKTRVSVYACDVGRKLALIALLKDASVHEATIKELQDSLETGKDFQCEFTVEAQVGAV